MFDPETATQRLNALDARAEAPDFWKNADRARAVMRERNRLNRALEDYAGLVDELAETRALMELAEEEGDDDLVGEGAEVLAGIKARAAAAELQTLLAGEADGSDCFVEIHAGAGGTESQDWAEMLLRMYARWADAHGFRTEFIEESPGEEAGIKSATVKLVGENAYGWLRTESGVHRLVRISPFDASGRRHTSFASVWVYPVVDDSIEIEIADKDLRVDTYRSSGAGGQHVNKTDSAVRITHQPTGIVVQCQNERSQHKNRAAAMSMLRARLYERELQARRDEQAAQEAGKTDIGWGHQIRSYVLQPYQMVKDLRTDVETSNVHAVLDGDIDAFVGAALAAQVGNQGGEAEMQG